MTADPTSSPAESGQRLVTVSASYGAGGSVVGPALARRLGVTFLGRVTTTAGELVGSEEALVQGEEGEGRLHWLVAALTETMPTGPTVCPPTVRKQDEDLRRGSEAGILRLADEGGGVILGRAAAVVLGKDRGFHVRLDGPAEARVLQGAEIEDIDLDLARSHQQKADRARGNYVRRLYHQDPADAALYHLVIDSTALPLESVVDVIFRAVARDTS